MTVTLNLSAKTKTKLQQLAAKAGQSVEQFIERHVEELAEQANGGSATARPQTWQEVCAPLATAMQDSTISDEEFANLIEEAREEIWQAKQAKQGKAE